MALFKNKLNGEDKASRKKERRDDTERQVSRMEREMDYIEAQIALMKLITERKASNADSN